MFSISLAALPRGRTKSSQRCRNIELLQDRSQFSRARHIVPFSQQFSISPKNKDVKTRCVSRGDELRRNDAIEIPNRKDIATGVARNLQLIVACLKPLRFAFEAMPHDRS
jgi:hypothetical protein